MKTLLALLITLFAVTSAHAEEITVSLSDPVVGHADVTYADLLRDVLPDLSGSGIDWTAAPPTTLRHIDGPDYENPPPDRLDISSLSVMTVKSHGATTYWVLFGTGVRGDQYAFLAVYDDAPRPRLIDAARVDADSFTSFVGGPVQISPEDEAVTINSSHFNAGENYQQPALVFLNGGKLTEIVRQFSYYMNNCTEFESIETAFSAIPTPTGLWTIEVKARHGIAKFDLEDGCGEPTEADYNYQNFQMRYVWNAGLKAYEAVGSLDGLYPDWVEGDSESEDPMPTEETDPA